MNWPVCGLTVLRRPTGASAAAGDGAWQVDVLHDTSFLSSGPLYAWGNWFWSSWAPAPSGPRSCESPPFFCLFLALWWIQGGRGSPKKKKKKKKSTLR
eukprot:TRINITY_DN15622_c0_g1_i1.p2 TRINITY_DN15622_c0_g1~~TRINITY_DN15622_c0_g1_i1.p2  ORF type:complete len:108 (+),score=35.05 TRINITY_DN15622_c0_g1_i1:32-325(+)